ncbi:hypothetical protein B1A99_14685 [Cohnella sp. CIP 111063]|jgi:uncharacterized Zn finger protein (UPF0148 family)|uniref:hypothetical protein n=1 Tax=unclassified Cohnella TaxID=2636738 RepID=UPI000B8BC77D|nr:MULTISPECIES: hypothetical protein [unclassified Cohnella]OXS58448.1 hypothetical protein B1A99_14685 [Cohnella sp. CIP 111063]PRX71741.1 hypothetical protein B0G52_108237 [Cohnella sp. SGD-V74]
MSVIICPWCQSEILQEEGEEPEKICPVCENELDGYRTLQFSIGEEEDEEEEDNEDIEEEERSISIDDEDLGWLDDESLESSEDLERFEEGVESLYDEQELVPECPLCHEYMIEAGERIVGAPEFAPRVPDSLGEPLLEAPFKLTMYVCPSCFTVHSFLGDEDRQRLVRRISQRDKENLV